jgi:outer membrane protein TolC
MRYNGTGIRQQKREEVAGFFMVNYALLVLFLILTTPAMAQEPAVTTQLSLSRAVERALTVFPSIHASKANAEEAQAALGEAAAARFPSFRLNGSAIQYEEPSPVSPIHGFTPGRIPQFDETLFQGGVGLNYTLFDGGGREAQIRRARSQTGSADAELDATSQALVARVVTTYLEVLSKQQVLEAHDHRLTALQSELSRVQKRYDAGRAARVEVLRVQAALANAQAERVKDAEALDRAQRDLARLIGAPVEEIKASSLISVTLTDPSLLSRDLLKAQALQSSPAVRQARQRLASAQAGVEVVRSTRWPELDLVGNYLYFNSGLGDDTAEWQAGAQLSYIIFNGGARAKAIERARATNRNASEQLRLTEIQVEQDVDRAFSGIEEAHARVESLETAVSRFEEVVRIEKLLRETGSGTETDYLNAEADLLTSRASLVEARHGEIAARVDLARVIGQLSLSWLSKTVSDRP